jgi:hypothetical protein
MFPLCVFDDRATNPFDDSDDKRVPHTKCTLDIRHAGVRPTARKPVQLFEFFRDKATITPVRRLNDVLEAGR